MRTILLRDRWGFASRHNVGVAASRILGMIAVAVAAALAGGQAGGVAASAGGVRSGLYGVVTRGPVTPVCRAGVPCTEPAPNVTLVFLHGGREAGRTRTDARGRYRVRLRATSYSVRTLQKAFGRTPTPARATVVAGRFRRVDFAIDTGIR
jgi:hypothetical protein